MKNNERTPGIWNPDQNSNKAPSKYMSRALILD
jgi:hypothetical protein